jgi:chromosome partitioning protein
MCDGNIIAIANQKGGVGKTTTTVNLAAGLNKLGFSVLLIDIDSQCNATTHLGYNQSEFDLALDDLLFDERINAKEVINNRGTLDFIPASINLALTDQKLLGIPGREKILSEKLEIVREKYDYIIIDCPPNLGLLSLNAFTAAENIIITVDSEYFALEGLNQLTQMVNMVQKRLNSSLKISGFLVTKFDARKNIHKGVRKSIYNKFPSRVFETTIRTNTQLSECPAEGKTIFEHDPKGYGAIDYLNFSKEVKRRYGW